MYKYFLLLIMIVSLYSQNLVDVYLLKSKSSYVLSDGDILHAGDKIMLRSNSKENVEVFFQINSEEKKPLQGVDFQKETLVLDEQIGTLKFIFVSNKSEEKISFFTNPIFKTVAMHDNSFSFDTDRDYINKREVISNDRGAREANVIIPKLEASTVIISSQGKVGAGAIVKDGKFIVTNYHVVEPDEENVYVAFKLKDSSVPSKANYFKMKVVKIDMKKDLALLEIPQELRLKSKLSSLELGSIKELKKGIDIYNMGHPLKYYYAFEYGMLNNILEDYSWSTHQAKKVLQYSMNSNKGNSGSPVVNEKLELIGIGAFSNTKGRNLNFAVSVEDIQEFLEAKQDVRYEKKDPNDYKDKIIQEGLYKNIKHAKVDRNNNGIPDAMMKDINNDGNWDVIAYDTDEDGSYDRVTSF